MRLFVALDIPDEVRAAIGALIAKLRVVCRSGRWVRIEGAHITLKFIGEVSAEKAADIKTALAAVPFHNPIHMSFRGLGFFPDARRPRVLWAGIKANADLGALAAAAETALEPLDIARERRAFSPHLTLARLESPRGLDGLNAWIAEGGPIEFGRAIANEFHLYESVLKRSGAEYTRLATYNRAGSPSGLRVSM
jgi:RNA 2',3'-cyclic 3'-phosphodiesterase